MATTTKKRTSRRYKASPAKVTAKKAATKTAKKALRPVPQLGKAKPKLGEFQGNAKAQKILQAVLKDLSDEVLQCLDPAMGHSWHITNDLHLYDQSLYDSPYKLIARDAQCNRCPRQRLELFLLGPLGPHKIGNFYRSMTMPAVPGLPRGMKPAVLVRQEQYRRAMEKATGVPKGTRLHER